MVRYLTLCSEPWLLIVDNADDPSLRIQSLLPAGDTGLVLITTRNPDRRLFATVGMDIVDRMSIDDSVNLLLRASLVGRTSDDTARTAAKDVVEMLGCLALAVNQAASYIRNGFCTLEEYPHEFRMRRKEILSRDVSEDTGGYEYTVNTAWEMPVKVLEASERYASKAAIELLKVLALCHFDGVPEELFERAANIVKKQKAKSDSYSSFVSAIPLLKLYQGQQEQWYPMLLRESLTILSSLSILVFNGQDRNISMHPLVHAWAADRLTGEELRSARTASLSWIAASIDFAYSGADYKYRRRLVPHIDRCCDDGRSVTILDDGK